MGDGVPTDQQQHNHCDCSGGHCSNHIVALCVCGCALRFNPYHKTTTAGTFHDVPSSSTRASLVSSVKTHLTKPPSQDRLDGRVCPEELPVTGETHTICAESVGERVKMIQVALSHFLISRPADNRWQGYAHGSGRVHGRASASASSWISTSTRLTTNKPDHPKNFTNKPDHQKNLTLKLYRSIVTNKHEHTSIRTAKKIEPMTMIR